ncbi:hypothetical protein [Pseudoramibacter alactolyticus]|uniref:hypothetical protein n=1 Tax=Pseudoramibacter alactolyticus TaxID=113287 RepID=UPI00235417C0|nr:hypothetical protein [Pseudoramibacter alactolyticus]MBM6969258.1 hypothetical protein [Pseudoramibacter alactolyticus]
MAALIKSKTRVQRHGEVFTPAAVIERMLGLPGVRAACETLTTTFLEPAAGEGAFLVAILRRKLAAVQKTCAAAEDWHQQALFALTTLYGIELLEDNVEMLVMNLMDTFRTGYEAGLADFDATPDPRVMAAARVIIQANMIQGDALTGRTGDGDPIVFTQWRLLPQDAAGPKTLRVAMSRHSLRELLEAGSGGAAPAFETEEQVAMDLSALMPETAAGATEPGEIVLPILSLRKET